jgi:hypothetical protein
VAKARPKEISVERLSEALEYNPETGLFTWKRRPESHFQGTEHRDSNSCANNWNSRWAGKPAMTHVGSHGYFSGKIFGTGVLAHRCAYAVMTGSWPSLFMDHINGVRTDNRWSNLRPCNHYESIQNRASYGRTCEYVGVYWNKRLQGDVARVYHAGKSHYCGFSADDPEKVARKRDAKARELFGEFAKLNFP